MKPCPTLKIAGPYHYQVTPNNLMLLFFINLRDKPIHFTLQTVVGNFHPVTGDFPVDADIVGTKLMENTMWASQAICCAVL